MSSRWKIYVKSKENLRTLLNLLLANRETELTIKKNEGLVVLVSDDDRGAEIVNYIREELGNKVERSSFSKPWKENVFLLNRPKFVLDLIFPFLIEASFFLVTGDEIHVKLERYSTINPLKKKRLGHKGKKVLYRVRLFTPILLRDYSNRDGKQSLTFERRNPLILTSFELSSLINGSGNDGLLAI